MNTQIRAGIRKELLMIWRSFRFFGIVTAFLGCAAYGPFSAKLIGNMYGGMDPNAEILAGVTAGQMAQSAGDPFYSTLGMIADLSMLLAMVLLTAAAGGEQKKRSVIMPQTAGLTPAGYVLPKFMLYPLLIFSVTMLSAFAADAMSVGMTNTARGLSEVLSAGALTGVYTAFVTCFYLFLGISTVQPGLSVVYVYAANAMIVPMIAVTFGVNKFTPWSLVNMAANTGAEKTGGIIATVVITLVLCFGFAFAALFAVTAKKTDNSADDEVY